jgi:hypothetical protein
MGILKSIGAVFAGLLAGAILSLVIDVICHATGIYPPWFQPMSDPLWVVALAYRLVFNTFGSFLTARLAPSRPAAHVIALAAVGMVLTALGVAANWNSGPEFGPRWFNLALVASVIPTAWAGYKLAIFRKQIVSN